MSSVFMLAGGNAWRPCLLERPPCSIPRPSTTPPSPASTLSADRSAGGGIVLGARPWPDRCRAGRCPRQGRCQYLPHDTFAALREAGYLAPTVPEEYGGFGASPLEAMLSSNDWQPVPDRLDSAWRCSSPPSPGSPRGKLATCLARMHPAMWYLCVPQRSRQRTELGSPSRGGGFRTVAACC